MIFRGVSFTIFYFCQFRFSIYYLFFCIDSMTSWGPRWWVDGRMGYAHLRKLFTVLLYKKQRSGIGSQLKFFEIRKTAVIGVPIFYFWPFILRADYNRFRNLNFQQSLQRPENSWVRCPKTEHVLRLRPCTTKWVKHWTIVTTALVAPRYNVYLLPTYSEASRKSRLQPSGLWSTHSHEVSSRNNEINLIFAYLKKCLASWQGDFRPVRINFCAMDSRTRGAVRPRKLQDEVFSE